MEAGHSSKRGAKPGKVTQTSIARDLGLSQALVSRVLNGVRERVDPGTYDRIWAQAVKLGYRGKGMTPHAPLAAAGGRHVGVVLRAGLQPFAQSNFFSHVQAGLHAALHAQGFSTMLLGSEETLDLASVGPLPPAIVVLGEVKPTFLRQLHGVTRRLVVINGHYPGLAHSVQPNEAQSCELLVSHLAALGHRRFGWLGGFPHNSRHSERLAAFRAALAAHRLPPLAEHACWIARQGGDRQEGREAALVLMRGARPPTALVAFNGVMARGAVNALLQNGWRIPAEVSLAAIDATRVSVEEEPYITCASTVPEKLGEAAARLLIASTGATTEDYQNLVLAAQFHQGATTGRAP